MNKDVIYIEPEDDITDIILKIENSKEKIIALVPPKKAGVFRSVVNIKLIAKAGNNAKKKIVLVTVDPSIKKLAAATRIPVTKNLQSAPSIPEFEEENDDTVSSEELSEDVNDDEKSAKTENNADESDDDEENTEEEEEEEEDEKSKNKKATHSDTDKNGREDNDSKENRIKKKLAESESDDPNESEPTKTIRTKRTSISGKNNFLGWIKSNKKLSIGLGIGGVVLILFLIWAFAIAPSVTVTVGIRTNSNNFSENVTFSTKLDEESLESGRFYLEEKKIESSQEVKFEATGKKNVGEKAKGEVDVYAYFPLNLSASTQIKEGESFTISGLTYLAMKAVTLEYSGNGKDECANKSNSEGLVDYGCRINGTVPVVAEASGSKYNISASSSGWDTNARVFAYSSKDMSGGTDEEITIVTQADIDKAKSQLASTDQEKNKADLLEKINEDNLVIESSFTQKTSDAVSSPAVGEEVKDGTTPTLKATTVASVYVIDKTKVEEFITSKANLGESQKIYEMKNPFIESFLETSTGYTGKLKTSYATGPKITENDVIEKIKGKGLGEAQHNLRDIDGVSEVNIDKSFPWVTSVPGDPNKITVILDVKDQNGNKVETKQDLGEDGAKEETKTEEAKKEESNK